MGKDNLMDSVIEHFPNVLKITKATESVLQDDIASYRIIRFSEVNANREDGANKHLVETIKQMAEGGISAMKKDARTGFKKVMLSEQEQKTVFFSTTEERRDEELETRFVTISIRKESKKIWSVNKSTLEKWANPQQILEHENPNNSWVKEMISHFKSFPVVIPFAPQLLSIFDTENPRSQRDVKRLMALTASHAWLYQAQRPKWKKGVQNFVVALPVDFINVFKIAGAFFNMTYKGLENRLQHILDIIEEMDGGDFSKEILRHEIEEKVGVSKNTFKDRLDILANQGFIKRRREGNNWFCQRCQTGCQSLLIGVNLEEIRQIIYKDIDTLYHPFDISIDILKLSESAEIDTSGYFDAQGVKGVKDIDTPEKTSNDSVSVIFDTLDLTPSIIKVVQEIPTLIKTLGNGKPIPIDTLFPYWPSNPETLEIALTSLKKRGDVFEPKPGYVGVLE